MEHVSYQFAVSRTRGLHQHTLKGPSWIDQQDLLAFKKIVDDELARREAAVAKKEAIKAVKSMMEFHQLTVSDLN